MVDEAYRRDTGGVAESAGDTDIDQLLRERSEIDSALRRHKAQLAVLFTDIVGSTAFFERFGDTAGLLMLQRHHELVLPSIEEAGGTVVKTIGDAVLATFPSADTAVNTATEIQRRLDVYNEDRVEEEQIYTRIGINFGTGFVKDQDFYGDVVNVAARFVKACAPAQILVSRSVFESLDASVAINCRKLGEASFHGKAEAEEVYEVLWTSPAHYRQVRRQLDSGEPAGGTRSVLGRYELLEELGRGAMGVVHKAYDPAVGRIIALKTVRLDVTGPDRTELVRRLRTEGQAAGRLEHRNIITIYDVGEAEGVFYLTMQFVKGRTLDQLIEGRALLPIQQIVLLFDQICEGLHYAHERGIIHRDLKPTNIIVTPEGLALIVDFGIAKIAEVGTTKAGTVLGTPSYMSPEQAQGARIDRRSDVFSLGSILYELLAGERPFPGNTPTAVLYKIVHEEPIPLRVIEPTVDPALDRIVRKALAKNAFERYQTCQEMREDLKAAAQPAPARPVRKAPQPGEAAPKRARAPQRVSPAARRRAKPSPRRGRLLPVLAFLVAAAAVAFVGWQQDWLSALGPLSDILGESQPSPPPSQPAATTSRQPSLPAASTAAKKERSPETIQAGSATPAERQPAGAQGPAPQQPEPKKSEPEKPVAEEKKPATPEATRAETPSGPPSATPQEKRPVRPAPAKDQPTLTPEQEQDIARWFRQAKQYVGRGQYSRAIFVLKQILELDPKNEEARTLLENVRKRQELSQPDSPRPPQ